MERLANQLLKVEREIHEGKRSPPRCFIGFDGFTDEIISVVKTRRSVDDFDCYEKMSALGETIERASGRSCNLELVTERFKIGGNAPILCHSLLNGGHHIYFVGCVGEGGVLEPLFEPMTSRCQKVWSLASSAHTDALEFDDGKIILGKHQSLRAVTFEAITSLIGRDEWCALLDEIDLFVSGNWTMLPFTTDIWEKIAEEFVVNFKHEKKRWMFVDLADPAKRTDEDVKRAVIALKKLQPAFSIVFGLNKSEAERVAKVLALSISDDPKEMAHAIQKETKFAEIVIHSSKFAVLADDEGVIEQKTRYNPKPVISTGAGDNFNAGYCNALLYQCQKEDRLLSAVANSGYYVSHGKSPKMAELSAFIKEWQQEERNDTADHPISSE